MASAARVLEVLRGRGLRLAVAESYTGGRLQDAITDVPGSSDVFLGGLVAYHDDVKSDDLRVPRELLRRRGAVSADTAKRMALNIRRLLHADVGISTTGIAGPTGATLTKPLGLSYAAVSMGRHVWVDRKVLRGNRDQVKSRGVEQALRLLLRAASRNP